MSDELFTRYFEGRTKAPEPSVPIDESLEILRKAIDLKDARGDGDHPSSVRPSIAPQWFWGVAIVLIAIVGIKYIPSTNPQSKTYTTTTGQRATITLADGSTAILAPATTLRVTGRNVDLSGEAVFTVTQHNSTPFIVKASGIETRVLGTTFGVRSYNKQLRVIVAEGRVSVAGTTLSIGDAANVDASGRTIVEHDANIGALLGWTHGRLAFRSVPLAGVANDLERWYGLQVRILDPKLAAEPVTAEFDNSPAETVISALAEVLHAQYKRHGTVVTFSRFDSKAQSSE